MQYHVWADRKEFLDASDADVASRFRSWVMQPDCPWYLVDEYADANQKKRRLRKAAKKGDATEAGAGVDEGEEGDEDEERGLTETEEESEQERKIPNHDDSTHILKNAVQGEPRGGQPQGGAATKIKVHQPQAQLLSPHTLHKHRARGAARTPRGGAQRFRGLG